MSRRSGLLFWCLAMVAAPAMADEPGAPPAPIDAMTVSLLDGSTYRGELVERVPGDHLTVKLATGEVKRFAWSELASPDGRDPFARGFGGSSPRSMVQLHVDADDPHATLFRVAGMVPRVVVDDDGDASMIPAEHLVAICRTPCDTDVDPRFTYRVGGEGLVSSRSILLPTDGLPLSLHVKTGSAGRRAGGMLLTLSAPSLIVAGVITALVGALSAQNPDSTLPPDLLAHRQADADGQRTTFYSIGGALAGVGLTALVTGIVLWATSGTTVTGDLEAR